MSLKRASRGEENRNLIRKKSIILSIHKLSNRLKFNLKFLSNKNGDGVVEEMKQKSP